MIGLLRIYTLSPVSSYAYHAIFTERIATADPEVVMAPWGS